MPAMPIEFCLPTSGKTVPSGPDWIHEVKSRGGMDWTRRFPWDRRDRREDPEDVVHHRWRGCDAWRGRHLRLQRPTLPQARPEQDEAVRPTRLHRNYTNELQVELAFLVKCLI